MYTRERTDKVGECRAPRWGRVQDRREWVGVCSWWRPLEGAGAMKALRRWYLDKRGGDVKSRWKKSLLPNSGRNSAVPAWGTNSRFTGSLQTLQLNSGRMGHTRHSNDACSIKTQGGHTGCMCFLADACSHSEKSFGVVSRSWVTMVDTCSQRTLSHEI